MIIKDGVVMTEDEPDRDQAAIQRAVEQEAIGYVDSAVDYLCNEYKVSTEEALREVALELAYQNMLLASALNEEH